MNQKGLETYPNCIIAGAPKSGTSSLFFWLGAHPDVCSSKLKETYFLGDVVNRHNKNLNIHDHGLENYQQYFTHCSGEKYRVEATPVYIYQQKPLEILVQLPKKPKVIFILRKPGDRLYSHWRFNRYRMKNTGLSFEEYLDVNNKPHNWADYIEQTHYVNFIKNWVHKLGKENILVYQFEKLKTNQKKFMQQVCRDLEIDPSFYENFDFFHRNETVAVKNKKLHRLGLKIEPLVPRWLQEKLIPFYLQFNSSRVPDITAEEQQLKQDINHVFRDSNEALKSLFPDLDLKLWQ